MKQMYTISMAEFLFLACIFVVAGFALGALLV